MSSDEEDQPPSNGPAAGKGGRRKDGRPYAPNNTGEDGDYIVGKNRTPNHTKFAKGDGRRRGRRPKGSRNFDRDWEDELGRSVRVKRDGRDINVSAHRAQVMTAMALAAKGKERSQEVVFRKASELADRKRSTQSTSDDQLIAEWLSQQRPTENDVLIVGDDAPDQSKTEDKPNDPE